MRKLFAILCLVVGQGVLAATPVTLAKGQVTGVNIGISGEEVWPFIDGKTYPYPVNGSPDLRIWDVNDSKVPQVIRNCMKDSADVLASWITNPHDPIHKALVNAGRYNVPTTFFLWTNDYTNGQNWMTTKYRRAQTWNWENSLLKWESTVDFGTQKCNIGDKKHSFEVINAEARKAAEAQGLGAQFVAPIWETEAENPKIADPGSDRLQLEN